MNNERGPRGLKGERGERGPKGSSGGGGGIGCGSMIWIFGGLLAAWSAYFKGWTYTWIGVAFWLSWIYLCAGTFGCHDGNGFACSDVPLAIEAEEELTDTEEAFIEDWKAHGTLEIK